MSSTTPTQDPQIQYVQVPTPKKKHALRNSLIGGVALLALIGGCSAAMSGGSDSGAEKYPVVTSSQSADTGQPGAESSTKAPAKPVEKAKPAQPKMTKSQEQAIGSAQSYLEFQAFSRKGLIKQLSSDAGEGFPKKDAIYAVDHIKVDWNQQAAKSAKSYLEFQHFSRKGLIEQLESDAGEGFTHAQAVYGVNKAGL